jgi:gas vesicle protein
MSNNTGKKIAVGALIAGAAGYVAGILTAPKSGKETRQDIKDKAVEVKDQAVEELKKAQAELNKMLHMAKDKGQAMSASARGGFNEAVIRAKDARNKSATVLKAVKAGKSDERELELALKNLRQAMKNLGKYLKN